MLYKSLKEGFFDVILLPEIVRKCPLPVNKAASFEAQEWILAEQLKQEIENSVHDILILDRCVIDNFVYMLRNFPEKSNIFLPFVLEHAKTYDYIFKTVPHEKIIKDNGFRDTDPFFRKEIENLLSEFLRKNNIRFHMLPFEDSEQFILDMIKHDNR